jgi:hypothetical protein
MALSSQKKNPSSKRAADAKKNYIDDLCSKKACKVRYQHRNKENHRHDLRDFWNREIQPILYSNPITQNCRIAKEFKKQTFTLKAFQNLVETCAREGESSFKSLQDFYQLVLNVFDQDPSLKTRFSKWSDDITLWCKAVISQKYLAVLHSFEKEKFNEAQSISINQAIQDDDEIYLDYYGQKTEKKRLLADGLSSPSSPPSDCDTERKKTISATDYSFGAQMGLQPSMIQIPRDFFIYTCCKLQECTSLIQNLLLIHQQQHDYNLLSKQQQSHSDGNVKDEEEA